MVLAIVLYGYYIPCWNPIFNINYNMTSLVSYINNTMIQLLI